MNCICICQTYNKNVADAHSTFILIDIWHCVCVINSYWWLSPELLLSHPSCITLRLTQTLLRFQLKEPWWWRAGAAQSQSRIKHLWFKFTPPVMRWLQTERTQSPCCQQGAALEGRGWACEESEQMPQVPSVLLWRPSRSVHFFSLAEPVEQTSHPQQCIREHFVSGTSILNIWNSELWLWHWSLPWELIGPFQETQELSLVGWGLEWEWKSLPLIQSSVRLNTEL